MQLIKNPPVICVNHIYSIVLDISHSFVFLIALVINSIRF